MYSIFITFVLISLSCVTYVSMEFDQLKHKHVLGELSTSEVNYLAHLYDESEFNKILSRILVPRTVGSPNHARVGAYIIKTLQKLDWKIEIDQFVDKTPKGNMTFKNIIAKINPNADRFLVLACHYDSKFMEYDVFVGATDAAVPCAMMIHLAKMYRSINSQLKNNDLSLQLIFFDGEEAFVSWGPKDSIYGARHLAKELENTIYTTKSQGINEASINSLRRIDVMMLLDLLGASTPRFYNYFEDTKKQYMALCATERRLYQIGLLRRNRDPYFIKATREAFIQDDHVPFIKRNVPVLHVIPTPFPDVWHTADDTYEMLDPDAIHDLSLIIRVYVAEYLKLGHVFVPKSGHPNHLRDALSKNRWVKTFDYWTTLIAMLNNRLPQIANLENPRLPDGFRVTIAVPTFREPFQVASLGSFAKLVAMHVEL